ncbi:MAG: DUF11 domain-containing protein [Acidimicrobiales bacterium]|nr:DUF11 domain-containing protein [Acidimicrobiales bacterium]
MRTAVAVFAAFALFATVLAQAGFGAGLDAASAAPLIIPDTGGHDQIDQGMGAQQDIAGVAIDGNTFAFAWDEPTLSGNNSTDTCTYFLEPDNTVTGVCYSVTFGGLDANDDPIYNKSFVAYDCGTTYGNGKCTGNNPASSDYSVTCQDPVLVDPYFTEDLDQDLQASCTILDSDDNAPTELQYINTCTKPSASASSLSNDCIFDPKLPDPGFLQLLKVVADGTAMPTDFVLTATNGTETVSGAGSTELQPVSTGDYDLTEASSLIDDGTYELDGISCVTNGGTPVDITEGVVAVVELATTVCTFTNKLAFIPAPAIDLKKTLGSNADEDGSGDVSAGDTLTYNFKVTNIGNVNLASVGVTDPLSGLSAVSCPQTTLTTDADGTAPFDGQSTTCTATYEVTAADVATGSIFNEATASGTDPDNTQVTAKDTEMVSTPDPSVDVVKSHALTIDLDGSGDVSSGDTLTYTFKVINNGGANLTNIVVTDAFTSGGTAGLSPIVCGSGDEAGLNDGDNVVELLNAADPDPFVECTATYVVNDADVAADSIANTATATADQASDTDTEMVSTPDPSVDVVKTVVSITNPDNTNGGTEVDEAGDVIAYTITATNNGTANLTNVVVTDGLTGFVATGGTTPCAFVAPGGTCTLIGTYTVMQPDLDDNGANPIGNGFINNTATGDSVQTGPETADAQVPVVQKPAHTLTKNFKTEFVTEEGENQIGEGETGTFELVYTNTGNVTLSDVEITDTVDPRLVVDLVTPSEGICSSVAGDVQDILCKVDVLAPDASVTVTVEFVALGEALLPTVEDQTSGATYVVYFDNGYVLYGSTALEPTDPNWATLLDENRDPVTGWSVQGANQDIFLSVPYGGGDDGGFTLHLSCSEPYIDGWGGTGPIEGEESPDWRVISYTVERFNSNSTDGPFKDCKQTFAFEVLNEASAMATPAGGSLDPNPIEADDTLTVVNIAPIEVTRDRFRKGAVEIQYFNTSFEALDLDMIQVKWPDTDIRLVSASYLDGVDLGISGSSVVSADIDTQFDARSKDWLKLNFVGANDKKVDPANVTVTIITDDGATFSYAYNPVP